MEQLFIVFYVCQDLLRIVLYNINGYYDGMKALLQHTADEKFMDASNMELCAFMDDPEQILAYIENYK